MASVKHQKDHQMSSPDSTKKRRIAVGNVGGGSGDDNGLDDGITMSTILAKLNDMQNEMNGMKSRLSRVDELEEKCQLKEDKCTTLETKCNAFEKKCANLDTRCESLQRSVQILSKESKWEYSAPPIPDSHWHGLPEEDIGGMKRLLRLIKGYTGAFRGGRWSDGEQVDKICLGQESPDNVEIDMLHHDDVLLPHWEEFANALQLHNVNDSKLSIANIQLTSEVLDLLAPALKGKAFTGYLFERNGFANNEGTKFITECIKQNNELQHLGWINNQIDNTKDAMLLVDAIVNHPSIDSVRIESCLGGEHINSYVVVCPLFASDRTWERIDIESNDIRTRGDTAIPDYIASNPPLKILYLANNNLNDDDVALIARALKQNKNLKQIRLGDNDFTDIGYNALCNVFFDFTSLNSISDSNHTCEIEDISFDRIRYIPDRIENSTFRPPKETRAQKIYQLLSERNTEGSNVQHLNTEFEDEDEDSLKLVPKVLAAIQHYHDATKKSGGFVSFDRINPLSIMYEVLRGWKMPEL